MGAIPPACQPSSSCVLTRTVENVWLVSAVWLKKDAREKTMLKLNQDL